MSHLIMIFYCIYMCTWAFFKKFKQWYIATIQLKVVLILSNTYTTLAIARDKENCFYPFFPVTILNNIENTLPKN